MHIPPYEQGNRCEPDPVRARKLLLHRTEIEKLHRSVAQKGNTLVPLKLYFAQGPRQAADRDRKGKKTHDKRAAIAERDAKREIARVQRRGERGE